MWRVATSGYAKVLLGSLAFDTCLASGLGRARPKYVFVRYRDLAYVRDRKGRRNYQFHTIVSFKVQIADLRKTTTVKTKTTVVNMYNIPSNQDSLAQKEEAA